MTDQMDLRAYNVSVAHRPVALLPPTSLAVPEGEVVLAVGPPGGGHIALALVLAGRLDPTHGQVVMRGGDGVKDLQRCVALVDVPGVTEPDGPVPFGTVIAEELSLAGLPARKGDVATFLEGLGAPGARRTRTDELDPALKIRALTTLASARPDTRYLVISFPERHGLPTAVTLALASEIAAEGPGVLVTASHAATHTNTVTTYTIGPKELQ